MQALGLKRIADIKHERMFGFNSRMEGEEGRIHNLKVEQ